MTQCDEGGTSSTDRREIEGPDANKHLVAAAILGTRHPPDRAAPTSSPAPGINLALLGHLEDFSVLLPQRFGHQPITSAGAMPTMLLSL